MARETSLWKWLSGARDSMRERVDLRRVEDSIGAGFPDVDGLALLPATSAFATLEDVFVAFPFKLELKSKDRPARASTPIRFPLEKRTAQIEFMKRRYLMGEAAYFLCQVGERAERMIYLAPGDVGARLRDGLTESELALICVQENGMVFDHKAKPASIIEGVRKCFKRRQLP